MVKQPSKGFTAAEYKILEARPDLWPRSITLATPTKVFRVRLSGGMEMVTLSAGLSFTFQKLEGGLVTLKDEAGGTYFTEVGNLSFEVDRSKLTLPLYLPEQEILSPEQLEFLCENRDLWPNTCRTIRPTYAVSVGVDGGKKLRQVKESTDIAIASVRIDGVVTKTPDGEEVIPITDTNLPSLINELELALRYAKRIERDTGKSQ